MGLIKKDIQNMKKDELIICARCRRRPINILTKYDISYKGNFEIAHCNSCGSSYKLQIISFESLIKSIEKQINHLEEKTPWGWRRNLESLKLLKRRLLEDDFRR